MITEGVFIALITGGLAVVSNILVAMTQSSKTLYRIEELEKKVEKHNQLIERTYKIERDLATAFVRIDEFRDDLAEFKKKLP